MLWRLRRTHYVRRIAQVFPAILRLHSLRKYQQKHATPRRRGQIFHRERRHLTLSRCCNGSPRELRWQRTHISFNPGQRALHPLYLLQIHPVMVVICGVVREIESLYGSRAQKDQRCEGPSRASRRKPAVHPREDHSREQHIHHGEHRHCYKCPPCKQRLCDGHAGRRSQRHQRHNNVRGREDPKEQPHSRIAPDAHRKTDELFRIERRPRLPEVQVRKLAQKKDSPQHPAHPVKMSRRRCPRRGCAGSKAQASDNHQRKRSHTQRRRQVALPTLAPEAVPVHLPAQSRDRSELCTRLRGPPRRCAQLSHASSPSRTAVSLLSLPTTLKKICSRFRRDPDACPSVESFACTPARSSSSDPC